MIGSLVHLEQLDISRNGLQNAHTFITYALISSSVCLLLVMVVILLQW